MQMKRLSLRMVISLLLATWNNHNSVHGTEVTFLLENNDVFEKCEEHPGNGVNDLLNMSNVQIEVSEYNVIINGSTETIWDVMPSDRIRLSIEVFKNTRGTWQPTVFNIIRNDFCKIMFSPSEIYHKAITSKIKPEERQCINVKGTKYHFEPIVEFLSFKVTRNAMDGRHKFIFRLEAFDEMDEKRPNDICFEVKGEFVKQ